jgi:hypothetical protein
MTYTLTVDDRRHGKATASILSLGKSGVAAIATNRYVRLAVITVGLTLSTLVLAEVSFNLAFNHPQQIERPFFTPR